ncbi:MAG: protein phosphatase 2C domain-containing protein [bacterium]
MAKCYSHLTCFALTDVGNKRKNNEDAYQIFPDYGVFIVADGMGGAEDGEVASKAIVDALSKTLTAFDPGLPLTCAASQAWVCQSVNDASAWILKRSNERCKSGTGSTFVGVCFDPEHPNKAVALHAGDSRVYSIRGTTIKQITRDHSLANAAGIKDEKDLNPKFRGVILRAVGLAVKTEVEATPFDVAEGDTVIVCSDGLSKMVDDPVVAKIVHEEPALEAAVQKLIEAALKNGGKDNVTVVGVRVGTLPEPVPSAEMNKQFPPDWGHAQTDSNMTPQTPLDPVADGVTRLTEYRTPLAPITATKPTSAKKKNGLPLLFIALGALLVAGVGGAGLGFYLKYSAEKQAALIEKIQDEARRQALGQIRAAEEAEVKRNAEVDAKRAEEVRLKVEAEKRQADEAAVKTEATKKDEAERLRVEAEQAATAQQKAEEQRKAEEDFLKAEAEKGAVAARLRADAEKKRTTERQKAEAQSQRLAAEKQRAEDEAERLAVAVTAGREDVEASEREKAVLNLVSMAKHEAQAKTYYTFMVTHAPRHLETSPLVKEYEEARLALVQWTDSQTLTAGKLKQLNEQQLEAVRDYAKSLALFLNTNAIELYVKKTRMKDANKKIWEQLVKESAELKTLSMDNDASRLRLVNIVKTISNEAK